MKYREKLIKLINKTKSDLYFAKKTYEDGDDDDLVGYLTYLVKELESINASINEQLSEDLEKAAKNFVEKNSPYTDEFMLDNEVEEAYKIAELTFKRGAQWQKEQTINKACEWLRRCVDVGDEVRMIDGEPDAESFIQKNLHRIEITNQIIADFKEAMEQC